MPATAKNLTMLKSKGWRALISTPTSAMGYDTSSPTTSMRRLSTGPVVLRLRYSLWDEYVDTCTSGTPAVYSVESKYVWCASSVNWIFSVSSCAGWAESKSTRTLCTSVPRSENSIT